MDVVGLGLVWFFGFFVVVFHFESNLKRQKQTLLQKAATIVCVHINDTFSLKTIVHGLLNSYNIQTNFTRNLMLFILSARYINSKCTIDKQHPPQKKKKIERGIHRECFPVTTTEDTKQTLEIKITKHRSQENRSGQH